MNFLTFLIMHVCSNWDDAYEYWYYPFYEMYKLMSNCPFACQVCEPPEDQVPFGSVCIDNSGFQDRLGQGCEFWRDYDCRFESHMNIFKSY